VTVVIVKLLEVVYIHQNERPGVPVRWCVSTRSPVPRRNAAGWYAVSVQPCHCFQQLVIIGVLDGF